MRDIDCLRGDHAPGVCAAAGGQSHPIRWLRGTEVVSERQLKADTNGVSLKAPGTGREMCSLPGCPETGVYSGPAEQCCSRKNCPPALHRAVCVCLKLVPRVGEQCLGSQPCCSCLSPQGLLFCFFFLLKPFCFRALPFLQRAGSSSFFFLERRLGIWRVLGWEGA